ncbi:MAG TPA: DUF488 domain-containing protein [Dehalococcoidia bacterium]|nr:DUF488 domain-containing protein [Dehalococcoidia bacterium]
MAAAINPRAGRLAAADALAGPALYTVGHSNQPVEALIALLRRHQIAALVDVRSMPRSRYASQFERDALRATLAAAGLRYAFMGVELGGRPRDEQFYDADGRVLYGRLAASEPFLHGIAQIEQARAKRRTALLCSEEDPRGCHRHLLIARVLASRGGAVLHIRGDGRLETEAELITAAGGAAGQLALFSALPEGDAWTSVRSVLRSDPPPPSSGR